MSVDSTGYIRVTHTGTIQSTIYLKDIDGELNRDQHQKVPVYVGPGNFIDILLNDRTLSSYTQGDIKTFTDLGYITSTITRDPDLANTSDTRTFHKPTITPSDSEVQPGQGPAPIVFGSTMGLHFDNTTDKAYRIIKVPSNYTGPATFHIHWTKSGDADESGNVIEWRINYTLFNGSSQDINTTPTVVTLTDTYEDNGTTSRIVYRTANSTEIPLIANYYLGIQLDYVAGNTTLISTPVAISADLLWEGYINQ